MALANPIESRRLSKPVCRCRRTSDPRKFLHSGCLTLQTLVWGGVIGCCFVMPNHVFYVWGQVCCSKALRAIDQITCQRLRQEGLAGESGWKRGSLLLITYAQ